MSIDDAFFKQKGCVSYMVGKGNSVVWRKLYREKNAQFWQLTSSFFFCIAGAIRRREESGGCRTRVGACTRKTDDRDVVMHIVLVLEHSFGCWSECML